MAKAKIAITLDEDLVKLIKRQVAKGRADSVSAYIEEALTDYVIDDELNEQLVLADIQETFDKTGGPPTPEEIEWADSVMQQARDLRS